MKPSPAAVRALDERMMARTLRQGRNGRPSPDPHVGALVVRGERIVGVGHQARRGGVDAPRLALRRAGARARGATLYLSLEPRDEPHGAAAQPIEDAIAAGVARVVVGCAHPAGSAARGRARLRAAGVAYQFGVCREQARALIADFAKWSAQRLPQVTLKAAITLDGRIATGVGDSKWITSLAARREAHRMRADVDAVLVGVATVLADDPELTVRLVRGPSPLRVVLDTRLRTPLRSKLVRGARQHATLIFCGPATSPRRRREFERAGVQLHALPLARGGGLRLLGALRELARRQVVRLLVEGGSRVHGAFLDAGLADQLALFVAPRILADASALPFAAGKRKARIAQALPLSGTRVRRLGPDLLIEGGLSEPP